MIWLLRSAGSLSENGDYQISWDSLDKSGETVPAGIYLYRLQAKNVFTTRKMLLIK